MPVHPVNSKVPSGCLRLGVDPARVTEAPCKSPPSHQCPAQGRVRASPPPAAGGASDRDTGPAAGGAAVGAGAGGGVGDGFPLNPGSYTNGNHTVHLVSSHDAKLEAVVKPGPVLAEVSE